jgi:hypothetical protein
VYDRGNSGVEYYDLKGRPQNKTGLSRSRSGTGENKMFVVSDTRLALSPHRVRVWGWCGPFGTSTGDAPKMCTWSTEVEWWSEGPYNSRLFRQPGAELGGRRGRLLPG